MDHVTSSYILPEAEGWIARVQTFYKFLFPWFHVLPDYWNINDDYINDLIMLIITFLFNPISL